MEEREGGGQENANYVVVISAETNLLIAQQHFVCVVQSAESMRLYLCACVEERWRTGKGGSEGERKKKKKLKRHHQCFFGDHSHYII